MESVARHILLLTLALEPKELMGIQGFYVCQLLCNSTKSLL